MSSLTRPYIEKYLVVPLAGRASEEPVFGGGTAGAGGLPNSDLARATRLATELEKSFGLGSYGLMCVGDERARAHDLLLFEHLRTAVRRSLDQAYATALELLAKHRHTLDALADAMFKGGYLDRNEIEAVLAKAPLHIDHQTHASAVYSQRADALIGKAELDPATAPDIAASASDATDPQPSLAETGRA
jgi:ATP-dependent Zn protease